MVPIDAIRLFSDLPEQAVRTVLAHSEERSFAPKQDLFHQGDPVHGLFLIRSGTVKLTQVGVDGQEVIMRLAGAGDVIAAVAAFRQPERLPVGATALDAVTAVFWERTMAQKLAEEIPALTTALTREISCQAHSFQMRLREVSTERVPQRLAQLLLRLAEQAGVPQENGVRIDIPLTRQDLAQMTGTTLYTVSRLVSEWADQGLVLAKRSQITLRSASGLRRLAESAIER